MLKCGLPGHYQSECLAPTRFYICKDLANTVADCLGQLRSYDLEMLGHGIKDQGFFFIDIGEETLPVPKNMAVIMVSNEVPDAAVSTNLICDKLRLHGCYPREDKNPMMNMGKLDKQTLVRINFHPEERNFPRQGSTLLFFLKQCADNIR